MEFGMLPDAKLGKMLENKLEMCIFAKSPVVSAMNAKQIALGENELLPKGEEE